MSSSAVAPLAPRAFYLTNATGSCELRLWQMKVTWTLLPPLIVATWTCSTVEVLSQQYPLNALCKTVFPCQITDPKIVARVRNWEWGTDPILPLLSDTYSGHVTPFCTHAI